MSVHLIDSTLSRKKRVNGVSYQKLQLLEMALYIQNFEYHRNLFFQKLLRVGLHRISDEKKHWCIGL